VGQNENFYIYGVAFHIFVAGNRRHFKFGMWLNVESLNLQMTTVPEMGVVTSRDLFWINQSISINLFVQKQRHWTGHQSRLQLLLTVAHKNNV